MSSPEEGTTCKVIAPNTLKEGQTFDATVDGITFTVTVPKGGVTEGDSFAVPYPSKNEANAFQVPTGRFRKELCGCFESCCCLFLAGWCCTTCVIGQVLERLNFNFCGQPRVNADGSPDTSKRPPICKVYTCIVILIFIISTILFSIYPESQYGNIPWSIFGWYMLIVTVIARYNMRLKYKIEANCCGDNCCGDCCTVWLCPCCNAIQMASHTHDPSDYHYQFITGTGLKPDAPQIV